MFLGSIRREMFKTLLIDLENNGSLGDEGMKRKGHIVLMLIGLLISGLALLGGVSADTSLQNTPGITEAAVNIEQIPVAFIPAPVEQTMSAEAAPSETIKPAEATERPESAPPAVNKATVKKPESNQAFQLASVNGISLNDTKKTISEKKGKPLSITKDPDMPELEIYAYPQMKVGFSDETVDFVEISAAAGIIQIDDTPIPSTIDDIKEALGEPDYVAEDGIVFQRKDALLKLFINSVTLKLSSIDYYHISET
jgi:hypothetical protein